MAPQDLPGFGAMLHEGVRGTLSDRKGLWMYGGILVAAMATVWSFQDMRESESSSSLSMGIEIALAYLAFYWQRRYLLGPGAEDVKDKADKEGRRSLNSLAFGYVVRAGFLYFLIAIVTVGVALPLIYPMIEQGQVEMAVASAVPVFAVVTLLTARFRLGFPAYAAGEPIGWAASWRLCKGRGSLLGLVVVLTYFPMLVMTVAFVCLVPLSFQDGITEIIVFNILMAMFRVLGLFVALTAAAIFINAPRRRSMHRSSTDSLLPPR